MKFDIEKLKWLMISRGLSYRELAKLANVSESTLYSLANDAGIKRRCQTISRVANALRVDAKEIVVL